MWPGGQKFISYSNKDNKKQGLKMGAVKIPVNSVFMGHGHVQHSSASWYLTNSMLYESYVILKGADFKYVVSSSYGSLSGHESALSGRDQG